MSDVISTVAAALKEKLSGETLEGTAKFLIEGEGAVMVEGSDVRVCDESEEADVTLTADSDTVEDMLSGDLNPTSAFMTGKLSVDGDMSKAMALAGILS
ncbi:SCP2 sterol-binding domain-containing protein [Pseudooceanicola sp. HF7]|uniref:SCP2 sterol-binding domain-containing protein n=1 Tax=Pseudooceanicola sp. HF7 TaxID=2721560 RepID=UPI0014316570|nr:SCP2 sterol-binding domain-containing protein [Pseudooceanicola sp. HF7]NIZ11168.1 sterol carrier family protein [Pseudooceanicola sp. HF7]